MASTPDAQQVRGGGGGGGHGGDTIPEGAASPQLGNTHQLDFYQAMGDFRVMFPNMDEEIIEAVLRANNGAVDATIDQLLTMNVDTTPTPPAAAFSAAAPAAAAAAYQPPEYATVTKKKTPARASNWSAQPPVLADSTSSEDEDPPAYPPYQVHSEDNTDLFGATSLPTNSSFALPKPLESSPTTSASTLRTQNEAPLSSKPQNHLLQSSANDTGNQFTPAPAFDPFDDPFFTTPAAPVAKAPSPKPPVQESYKEEIVFPVVTRSSETPKRKLYKPRWNPPLLGDLPDDFLRIMIDPSYPAAFSAASPSSSKQQLPSPRIHHGEERRSSSKRKPKNRDAFTPRREQSPSQHQAHSPSTATLNSDMIAARIAENSRQRSEVKANTDKAQMLDDEMFALYLQNEEFLNDLRQDEDFMRTLERERMNATAFEPAEDPELDPNRPKRGQLEGYGDDGIGAIDPHDKEGPHRDQNEELRRQLKHMGGSSKKKLQTLARRFFSRTKKKKAPKTMLRDAPLGPSKHNLLEEEDSPGAMGSLREDSESNLGRSNGKGGGEGDVGAYLTVQRPPYHPDCITTYCEDDPNARC